MKIQIPSESIGLRMISMDSIASQKSPELQESLDVCGCLAKLSGEEPEVWAERMASLIMSCMVSFVLVKMGKALSLGFLVGTTFQFSKGMLSSPREKRLIGGWRKVKAKKWSIVRFSIMVCAHVGLFIAFGLVVPAYPVTAPVAYFGAVGFFHTRNFLKAGLATLSCGFLGWLCYQRL